MIGQAGFPSFWEIKDHMVKNTENKKYERNWPKRRTSTHSVSPAWGDRGGACGAGGVGVAGGAGGAVGCGSSIGLNWVPVLVRSWVYWTTGPLLLTAPTGKRTWTTEMIMLSPGFMHTPDPQFT